LECKWKLIRGLALFYRGDYPIGDGEQDYLEESLVDVSNDHIVDEFATGDNSVEGNCAKDHGVG
jgi:hypothetical protein